MNDCVDIVWRRLAALLVIAVIVGMVESCTGAGQSVQPSWVDEPAVQFPPDRYLVGMGQAESRPAATERAYAAVARIFKAEVKDEARDWESYLLLEHRGQSTHQRRLTIDHITQVSTDKVLENVRVLGTWHHEEAGVYYVLAGLERAQAETALLERIRELDRTIAVEVRTARQADDELASIRNFRRAGKELVLREAYNADLRIVRQSGQGDPPPYRVAELTAELERFIETHLVIGVEVTGEEAETIRRAVMEGLVREGLPVTDRELGKEPGPPDADGERGVRLLVRGHTRLWDADVPDPTFTYVRWCSDFVILDVRTERVVGAVSRRGREGHLTRQEATNRAVRVMQQELTADLAKSLAGYVYGDGPEGAEVTRPAACPRDSGRAMHAVPRQQAFL